MAIINYGKYNFDIENDRFLCKYCSFTAEDEDEMIRHVTEVHGGRIT